MKPSYSAIPHSYPFSMSCTVLKILKLLKSAKKTIQPKEKNHCSVATSEINLHQLQHNVEFQQLLYLYK